MTRIQFSLWSDALFVSHALSKVAGSSPDQLRRRRRWQFHEALLRGREMAQAYITYRKKNGLPSMRRMMSEGQCQISAVEKLALANCCL